MTQTTHRANTILQLVFAIKFNGFFLETIAILFSDHFKNLTTQKVYLKKYIYSFL